MPTQAYLDATRNGSFDTPAEWDALAQLWQDDIGFVEADAEAWVNVKIEVPNLATMLVARGVTPEDVGIIRPFFDPDALPPLEQAIAAISVLKGLEDGGVELGDDSKLSVLNAFFLELSDGSVSLSLDPP